MTVIEYAKKILADHGCDEYTYGGEWSKHVLDDLKEAYPDGMDFPYVDVANAILSFSRARPIERAPFQMLFDTGDCVDGIDFDSFEAAKNDALDTLIEWEVQETHDWQGMNPTEEQIESWDYMIYNCSVEVREYDPSTDEYETVWEPTYEDEESVGWMPWEDYKKLLINAEIIKED